MTAIPAWAAQYVGIPYREKGRDRAGCDCWGLCALVWRERYLVDVPSYAEDYATPQDSAEIAALITDRKAEAWRSILDEHALPGDAVLLRVAGRPIHVGVMVAPPWFLHVLPGTATVLQRLDTPAWVRRVLGLYRHVDLDQRAA